MEAHDLRNALSIVAATLKTGDRNNHTLGPWETATLRQHLSAAAVHLEKAMVGMRDEDHIANAICRLLFILEIRERARAHSDESTRKTFYGRDE
jgi:hypothetical protein